MSLLVRASKPFARWVYSVPKWVATLLKLIRASVLADQELALRLLKTLQHVLVLEKKACLVVRLEGGIKLLLQCVSGGGGGSSSVSSAAPTGRATASAAAAAAAAMERGDAPVSALAAVLSATSLNSSSSSSSHSSQQQKVLRVVLEVLLLVLKANEHSSTAIVAQSLPHLSNLLQVLRFQQGHVRIFQTTLQVLVVLCKEKKILTALVGTMPATSADELAAAAAAGVAVVPAVPPPSASVLALVGTLGPGVTSFMTWCMATLLTSKNEYDKHGLIGCFAA